jgi:hypothetical protein
MQMPGRNYSATEYRFGFNGQEKDNQIYGSGNSYTAEFWQYDARLGMRWNLDPKPNPSFSGYSVFEDNPNVFVDPKGDTVYLYAVYLPSDNPMLDFADATHTFVVVKDNNGEMHYYAYGPTDGNPIGGKLGQESYPNDKKTYKGRYPSNIKARFTIDIPEGMTSEEFDAKVMETAESFGDDENKSDFGYSLFGNTWLSPNSGNCNSSSYTLLKKSGAEILPSTLPGVAWGWGQEIPWTEDEQKKAIDERRENLKENESKMRRSSPGMFIFIDNARETK